MFKVLRNLKVISPFSSSFLTKAIPWMMTCCASVQGATMNRISPWSHVLPMAATNHRSAMSQKCTIKGMA